MIDTEIPKDFQIVPEDQYIDAGVNDSVAENQGSIEAHHEVETAGQPVEAEQPQEHVSDKDYNFRAMREEIARIKAEKEALEENFDLWKRELAVQRQPEAPRKSAEEVIPDDDLITGAQLKRLLQERDERHRQVQMEQEIFNQEAKIKLQHSDYDEVATKYGVPLLKQEPDLAQAFMASNNKAAFLYKIGKMQQVLDKEPVQESQYHKQEVNKAERIVANSRKPGTLSGAVGGQQQISKADYYSSLSDAEFNALVAKNLEEI